MKDEKIENDIDENDCPDDYIDKILTEIDESLKGLIELAKTHNKMIVNLGKRVKTLEEQK